MESCVLYTDTGKAFGSSMQLKLYYISRVELAIVSLS